MPIHITLADGEPSVRSALQLMLENQADVRIVGIADSAKGLLEIVQAQHPAVVFMDWFLRGAPAPEVLTTMRRACPGVWVIVLCGNPELKQIALEAGADEFVSKGDPPERLLAALHAVLSRGSARSGGYTAQT